MRESRDYIEYTRCFQQVNGKGVWNGWGQAIDKCKQSKTFSHPAAANTTLPDTAVLRLVRVGDTLTLHTDTGNGKWDQEAVATMTLPDTVTVGVYVGGRKGPFTAEFSEFTLTPAK